MIELAAARGFERGANFGGMVAIIIDDGDVVDYALDVEAAANAGEFCEAFPDEVGGTLRYRATAAAAAALRTLWIPGGCGRWKKPRSSPL